MIPDWPTEFHARQRAVADWCGYETVAELNADHDPTHRALCAWLGIPSQSMREAAGEPLTPWQQRLAIMEEEAVLFLQRLATHTRAKVPGVNTKD